MQSAWQHGGCAAQRAKSEEIAGPRFKFRASRGCGRQPLLHPTREWCLQCFVSLERTISLVGVRSGRIQQLSD